VPVSLLAAAAAAAAYDNDDDDAQRLDAVALHISPILLLGVAASMVLLVQPTEIQVISST
jgi:hypothetical protein